MPRGLYKYSGRAENFEKELYAIESVLGRQVAITSCVTTPISRLPGSGKSHFRAVAPVYSTELFWGDLYLIFPEEVSFKDGKYWTVRGVLKRGSQLLEATETFSFSGRKVTAMETIVLLPTREMEYRDVIGLEFNRAGGSAIENLVAGVVFEKGA